MSKDLNPEIPKYTDDEVTCFHPVFESAAKEAIKAMNLHDVIDIKHHFPTASGPVDFVFLRIRTNKVILPVEIKRTQSGMRGAGRRQARDYYNNLGNMMETRYYAVTNLEAFELFKDHNSRQKTSSQQVHLTFKNIGTLGEQNDLFRQNIVLAISEILEIALNDSGKYQEEFVKFQQELDACKTDKNRWHQYFIPVSFEYIRGVSEVVPSLKKQITSIGWKAADTYKHSPDRLIDYGSRINFNNIFCQPVPPVNDPKCFNSAILSEAYMSGKNSGAGDDIAELVVELFDTPTGQGIVQTDPELAGILAVAARDSLGKKLDQDKVVFDPGAATGRLITALNVAFPEIQPSQVWANDIDWHFVEPLALRIGLSHSSCLSPTNSPRITFENICNIAPEDLLNVGVIVMNPPYISGINSVVERKNFSNRIKQISNAESILNIGQAALELVFLELTWRLSPKDCVVATVFPIQHLTRIGKEAKAFRNFLVHDLKLTHIVTYPRQGIFESVIKQTVLLIGKKNKSSNTVKFIDIQIAVSEIDTRKLLSHLVDDEDNGIRGLCINQISDDLLNENISVGWKNIIGVGNKAIRFIQDNFYNFSEIDKTKNCKVHRGKMGNKGHTQLVAMDFSKPKFPQLLSLIPNEWRVPAVNTADKLDIVFNSQKPPNISFVPPDNAYSTGTPESDTLDKIISAYLPFHELKAKSTKQKVNKKSINGIKSDLKSDLKLQTKGFVLIPRGARKEGKISIVEGSDIIVSTNFIIIEFEDVIYRQLFASWMLSIFGQMQLEVLSTPQEGMRKLEKSSIQKVRLPDFASISKTDVDKLVAALKIDQPIDLVTPKIRKTDEYWAEILSPKNSQNFLQSTLDIFQELLDERNSLG